MSEQIDTTPHAEPMVQSRSDRAEIATPNGASTPVWSLTADRGEPSLPRPERSEENIPPASKNEPEPLEASPSPLAQAQSSQPAKKGWWQRTFRPEE